MIAYSRRVSIRQANESHTKDGIEAAVGIIVGLGEEKCDYTNIKIP